MTQQLRRSPLRFWLDRVAAVLGIETASSRAAAADVYPHHRTYGIGHDWTPTNYAWTPTNYAEYYAKSVPVYAAVTRRADAMARTPLIVERIEGDDRIAVGEAHGLQRLLDRSEYVSVGIGVLVD